MCFAVRRGRPGRITKTKHEMLATGSANAEDELQLVVFANQSNSRDFEMVLHVFSAVDILLRNSSWKTGRMTREK